MSNKTRVAPVRSSTFEADEKIPVSFNYALNNCGIGCCGRVYASSVWNHAHTVSIRNSKFISLPPCGCCEREVYSQAIVRKDQVSALMFSSEPSVVTALNLAGPCNVCCNKVFCGCCIEYPVTVELVMSGAKTVELFVFRSQLDDLFPWLDSLTSAGRKTAAGQGPPVQYVAQPVQYQAAPQGQMMT